MDPVDPIVLTKHVQSTSYSFIEAARRDFDGMFRAVRVETRYFASSKTHELVILAFRFSFAKSLTRLAEGSNEKIGTMAGLDMRFYPFQCR